MEKTKMRNSDAERKELITTLGDAHAVLMDYYYECVVWSNQSITNKRASHEIGWSLRKTQKVSKALIDNGWFRQVKKGNTTNSYVGKESVKKSYQKS